MDDSSASECPCSPDQLVEIERDWLSATLTRRLGRAAMSSAVLLLLGVSCSVDDTESRVYADAVGGSSVSGLKGTTAGFGGMGGAGGSGGSVPAKATPGGSGGFANGQSFGGSGANSSPSAQQTGGNFGISAGQGGSFVSGGTAFVGAGMPSSVNMPSGGGVPASGTGGAFSSGGGGAFGAAGDSSGECTPGAKRCDPMGKSAQVCSANAHWESAACEFVCLDSACAGVCTPGSRQCDGSQPQRCNEAGAWVPDGAACMAQCEQGACTGACKNDATQCRSNQSIQTCDSGQWGAETSCEFACVEQKCGGLCDPQATRCANGTEVETCSDVGQWGNRRTCDLVCTGNSCGGVCKPNSLRCSNGQEDRCNAQGQWEKSQSCPFLCVNNACGGVCSPGATRCKSTTQAETCSAQGQWTAKNCSSNVCANNDCRSCAPGALKCDSKTQIRTCNANGEWGNPTDCKAAACFQDECTGECAPGTASCEPIGKSIANVCGDDGEFDQVACTGQNSCEDGKCAAHRKYVFVTSQLYTGNLGGITGADRKCQERADAANLPGDYKALLADADEDLTTRFNLEGGPFIIKDGQTDRIVAPNWDILLTGQLLIPINRDESGNPAPKAKPNPSSADFCGGFTTVAWANIRSGKIADAASTCNQWTSSTASGAPFGNYADTQDWAYYCRMGRPDGTTQNCKTEAPLICFQQ